jgi:tetratricopeptide (TPR) repeat protein
VRSLLNALGLTIWGLVAFGLLIVFMFVGFEAAMKWRHPAALPTVVGNIRDQPSGNPLLPRNDTHSQTPSVQANHKLSPDPVGANAARSNMRSLIQKRQYRLAVGYGEQLASSGNATAEDLIVIAQSYFRLNDCSNAMTWVHRADAEFRASGRQADESIHEIEQRCKSDDKNQDEMPELSEFVVRCPSVSEFKPRVRESREWERAQRLLTAAKARADADCKNLPTLEAAAEQSKSGELDVKLGEVLYGFGDYRDAIIALERGLGKGEVKHLDEAYVYLGLSQQAVSNLPEARKAFSKLKSVPGISPRVLMLWELYAQTRL